MINKPLVIVVACVLASCGIPSRLTVKLNISDFNQKQIHDTARFYNKHDVQVTQVRLPDGSFQETSRRSDHTTTWYRYFYSSGQIKGWTIMVNGFNFGRSPLYDEKGKLVSITDYDAPYIITINKLGAKFAFAYGLDIFKEGTTIVKSTAENNNPIYRVTIPINTTEGNKARRFVVDGMTGKTLSDDIVTLGQKEKEVSAVR